MVQKLKKKKNWIFLLTEKPHVPQKNPFHILSNSLRGGHIKAKSSCRYWNIIAIEKSLFFAKYTVIIKYTAYVDKRHWYWQSWQVILYIYYCSRLSCCRSVKTSQRQSYTLNACCTPRTGICSIISSTLNKQTKKIKNLPSSVGLWLCIPACLVHICICHDGGRSGLNGLPSKMAQKWGLHKKRLRAMVRKYQPSSGKSWTMNYAYFLTIKTH